SGTPKSCALRLRIMPLSRWHPSLPLNNWTSVSRQTGATHLGLPRGDPAATPCDGVCPRRNPNPDCVDPPRGVARPSIGTGAHLTGRPAPGPPQTFARMTHGFATGNPPNAHLLI